MLKNKVFFSRLTMCILICMFSMTKVSAQSWTDFTKDLMQNPKMNGSVYDWDVSVSNAWNVGYQGASYSNGEVTISGFAEAWLDTYSGTLGDGKISHTARLQTGKYRLQADCIAVRQHYGYTASGVYLYAKDVNGNIYREPVATDDGKPKHFTLEFEITKSGMTEFGLLLESPDANWVAVDNFTMEYYGKREWASIVKFVPSSMTLGLKEKRQFTTTFTPSTVTVINYRYYSQNSSVVTVDEYGNVTGKGAGSTTIYAVGDNDEFIGGMQVSVTKPTVYQNAIVINEIQSCNLDMYLDPSMNYGSWIEIYNPTDRATGLGGIYITDDLSNMKKWKIRDDYGILPAHGYRNIWFDHYGIWKEGELTQVDFKLNPQGGTIYLTDGEAAFCEQSYPKGISRTSYARKQDGGAEWGYSATPTPEGSNNAMAFAETQLPAPEVIPGKLASSSLSISTEIGGVPAGATLRYTTDGSTPTESSTELNLTNLTNSVGKNATAYVLNINESGVYRFRVFQDGYLPSEVVTRSFIVDNTNLPVISIVTEQGNLNSSDYGIFVKGPNGRPGNGQDQNCNWNMDWDRPVNFEYFNENKEYALCQEVDMSMCGGWSRANSPHSFKLKASKTYNGLNSMDYQFFESKPFLKHKVLQIRNGGSGSRIKDSSLQEIMRRSGLYIDTQAWKPVRVYINGSFYADLNMREPNNKHFAYANYGIDTDYMDQFEMSPDSGYVQMAGTKDSFNQLLNLSRNAADPITYQKISELLDLDEYINYMAVELYLGNWDWPQNNVKGFRDQNDGKFHFVIYDLDGAFSADISTFFGKQWYTFDNLRGEDALGNSLWGTRRYQEIEFVTLFNNMLDNEDFRKRFVDAMSIIGGSVFDYEYAYGVVSEMQEAMGTGNIWEVVGSLSGRQWSKANELRQDGRFGVTDIEPQNTSLSSNVDGAQIQVNGMVVPMGKFNGYLFSPVTVTASAPAGYKFKGWRSNASAGDTSSPSQTLFTRSSSWTYDDSNSPLDGTGWQTSTLSGSGLSPIGYDTNGSKSFNTYIGERYQTYYFTKTFNIADKVDPADVFTLDYTVDDGMVVYINGEEAGRYNMPDGEISFYTNGGWAQGNPDSGTMTLSAGLFKLGTNTIAVEVHNFFNPTSSTDIYWDASLTRTLASDTSSDYYTTQATFNLPASGDYEFVAEYEPLTASEQEKKGIMPVKVNEVSASNDMYVNDQFKKDDWIELYNTTDAPIDIAGMYLSDDDLDPQKFQIPANDIQQTVIAPHSHLVLWASKRTNIGEQIHTNFKLSNNNGSAVLLTSADGEWSDKLTYNAHGAKETVGVYPDGSENVYHLYRPTIGAANTLTSYAEYIYDNTPSSPEYESFILTLSDNWNWVSHPLERSIGITEINRNATRILTQTGAAYKDDALGWIGNITSLSPTSFSKIRMASSDEFTFGGPFFAEGNTIALLKGWNWIGYPVRGKQTVAEALSRFTPSEGDKIIGQSGFTTFENGKWSGTLETFTTGSGYLYYSAMPKSLSFVAPASVSSQAKPRFTPQPLTAWTASPAAYPDVMGVVAKIVADGEEAESGAYSVGAFSEDGECRGVGKYVDGKLFITVYGNAGDEITFRAADASTGIVYDVTETLTLDETVNGSRKAPLSLHIGEATDIASVKTSSAFSSITYFTLGGVSAGSDIHSLTPGVYVAKISLIDGGTITKKIIKKQ